MPFSEINIVPSVNIESTSADNPSGIQESQFIRWKAALPEKRGGASLYINDKMAGVPVELQPWGDISGKPFVATATTEAVYAYDEENSNNRNISPENLYRHEVKPNISTVKGSSIVTITDASVQNVTTYDSVTFNTPVAVTDTAGNAVLLLSETYEIINISGVSSYDIDVGFPVSTTVNNGGILPQFSTSPGSTEVTITFPIQYQTGNLKQGDRIGFAVSTEVGGITIYGQYVVSQVLGNNKFIIVDNQVATASDAKYLNNGFADLTYWIIKGPTLFGSGYGTWAYGQWGYGAGSSSTPLVGNPYSADNWYLDNRGSALIASAVGGPIFFWTSSSGYDNLGIIAGAPVRSNGAFVAMPYGNIMAWGCSTVINPLQDPLFIRWSDSNDPNNWSINQSVQSNAGFYTIPTGSKIVRGFQGQTQQYWFTDVDVYAAQYTGYPGTFGFNKIGSGCGLVAPKAVGSIGGNVFWMSNRQFFVCPAGGTPQPVPCSVWDFIFQNMDYEYQDRVVCGTNSLFNEVSWFFPTKSQGGGALQNPYRGIPDAYVCYNTQYNEWDVGYINRTAWFDQSLVGEPISADSGGYVYKQETSNNLAIGPMTYPMNSWFKTGFFSLTQGQDLSFVDWVLPDFKWGQYDQLQNAEIKFTFYVTDYAGQTPREYGPYACTKETPYILPRIRGRFMAMKIESTDMNSFWRLGSIRYRFAPSGRR